MFKKIVQGKSSWKETLCLPTILSSYGLENIFNGDEFGFFFHSLSIKTLELKRKKCSAGKHSKVRLTGMCAASATDEKLPLSLEREKMRNASRRSRSCHVSTKYNQNAG